MPVAVLAIIQGLIAIWPTFAKLLNKDAVTASQLLTDNEAEKAAHQAVLDAIDAAS